LTLGATTFAEQPSFVPKKGFVPDEKTAITVAEAILVPIYGEKLIAGERPFHAALNSKGIWTVQGSLPAGSDAGGVAIVRIERQTGRILYVMHGK
jgi:hypothetical protein